MLRGRRRSVGGRCGHLHRAADDETELVVLPLQRRPEDVRPALGVSVSTAQSVSGSVNLTITSIELTTQTREEDEGDDEED